jgi:hypothetical protein
MQTMDGSREKPYRLFRAYALCGLFSVGTLAAIPDARGQAAAAGQAQVKAAPISDPPKVAPQLKTNYSLDPKTTAISFPYLTSRNGTSGHVTLISQNPSAKLKIIYNDGSGNPPTNFIILTVGFTYQGKSGKFSTDPVAPDAGQTTYTVDLTKVAAAVITMINNRLPPSFDPDNRGEPKFTFSGISFSATPVATSMPVGGKPVIYAPQPVDPGTVTPAITVDEVVGDQS